MRNPRPTHFFFSLSSANDVVERTSARRCAVLHARCAVAHLRKQMGAQHHVRSVVLPAHTANPRLSPLHPLTHLLHPPEIITAFSKPITKYDKSVDANDPTQRHRSLTDHL